MTLKPSLRDELEGLRSRVSGHLLAPGDTGFDEARAVWNAMIDRRPAAIVRASAVDDIAPTIALARERGPDLAVRGGGHNVAGNGTVEGGIVLDLGDLNAVTVDPASRTVRCRAGPRWRTSTPPPNLTAWSCRWESSQLPVSRG